MRCVVCNSETSAVYHSKRDECVGYLCKSNLEHWMPINTTWFARKSGDAWDVLYLDKRTGKETILMKGASDDKANHSIRLLSSNSSVVMQCN